VSEVRRDSDGRGVRGVATRSSVRLTHGAVVGVVRSTTVSSTSLRLTTVVVSEATGTTGSDSGTLTHESLDSESSTGATPLAGAENHGRPVLSVAG